MDLGREAEFSAGYVAPVMPEIPRVGGLDQWSGPDDQAVRSTDDEYNVWNGSETPLNSDYDSQPSLIGSEPPTKKARNFQSSDSLGAASNRSKVIGKMFFKTKLCCNFRAGVCPYITNCNFAHGVEELRRPPPNWQEIVAAYEERGGVVVEPPREEHQIPTFSSSDLRGESQRLYKSRHCKKFFTDEGCPYGDSCTFLHDEQSRARESFAISLSPSVVGGYGNGFQKPSNWKTRICNKWETTGTCPFGNKCHFAHGYQELHKYGGVPVEAENREFTSVVPDTKQTAMQSRTAGNAVASVPSSSNVYRSGIGVPSHVPSSTVHAQAVAQGAYQKWRGPDKISKIYGDWIDDIE